MAEKIYIIDEKDRDEVLSLIRGHNPSSAINFLKQLKLFEDKSGKLKVTFEELKKFVEENKAYLGESQPDSLYSKIKAILQKYEA